MPNLDRSWSYKGKVYGPGETEIPDGLRDILGPKGYLGQAEPTDEEPLRVLELSDYFDPQTAKLLRDAGYPSPVSVASAADEDLLAINGIGPAKLQKIREVLG